MIVYAERHKRNISEFGYVYPLEFMKIWMIFGWLFVAVVVLMSLWPESSSEIRYMPRVKIGHLISYMVLMLWFSNIYPKESHRALLCAYLFVMGVCLEFLQVLSPGRSFSFADIVVNALGLLIGWALARAFLATSLSRLYAWLIHAARKIKVLSNKN